MSGGTVTHPLVYLRGVPLVDLEAILDFVYYGEVKIDHENLDSFLAIAEDLQIKGLATNKNRISTPKRKRHREAPPKDMRTTSSFELGKAKHAKTEVSSDVGGLPAVKQEPNETMFAAGNEDDCSFDEFDNDFGMHESEYDEDGASHDWGDDDFQDDLDNPIDADFSQTMEEGDVLTLDEPAELKGCPFSQRRKLLDYLCDSKLKKNRDVFQCQVCSREHEKKQFLRGHVEAKHLRNLVLLICTICGTREVNRRNMREHVKTHADVHNRGANYNITFHGQGALFAAKALKNQKAGDSNADFLRALIDQMTAQQGDLFKCTQCGFEADRNNVKTHVEAKHVNVRIMCNLCPYVTSTRNNMRSHISVKHRGEKLHDKFKRNQYRVDFAKAI